jgi:regulator of ribosome biosynthesis
VELRTGRLTPYVPHLLQPPPEAKKETKWEKFARERGLPLNKEKRSQKVFDEESGTWMFRHGYQKANNESKEWPIMEVKGGADPFADPWEKKRDEKRTRVEKNVEQRMRNEERAGNLEKGTTNKVLKSRERSRKAGKEGGNADRDQPLPAGLPVDIKNRKSDDATTHSQRGKISTLAALKATQRSTASLGKFDKMREGEPEKKKILLKAKKRKLESSTDRKVLSGEAEKSLKVLKSVVDGGGVAKERDIRRGKYAQGETAYDYQFDDGLGPSTFKKKKGRAGAGKSKKMTKKRIK